MLQQPVGGNERVGNNSEQVHRTRLQEGRCRHFGDAYN